MRHNARKKILFLSNALFFGFIFVGGVHLLSSTYEVKQRYLLSGEARFLPAKDWTLHTALGSKNPIPGVTESLSQKTHCRKTDTERVFLCSTPMTRSTSARAWLNLLREQLPRRLGHIAPEQLPARSTELEKDVSRWETRLSEMIPKLNALLADLPVVDRAVRKEKRNFDRHRTDFTNRKRQLALIVEAPQETTDPKRKEIFRSKQVEIEKILGDLDTSLHNSKDRIHDLESPIRLRQTLDREMVQLVERIETTRKHLRHWTALQEKRGLQDFVPDPHRFQAEAVGPAQPLFRIRTWRHLFFSLPLGLLLSSALFVLQIRFFGRAVSSSPVFATAKEVEAQTGLKLLGYLPLPPEA